MKTQSNFRKSSLDNSFDTQAKLKFICVVEDDLDFNDLQSTSEQNSTLKSDGFKEKVKRYKYLCYLRSMDDMC